MSQPVLPFLSAEARSVGPSAGLLEGLEGGVVFASIAAARRLTVDVPDRHGNPLSH